MSRDSRFDKLEHERGERPERSTNESRVAEERFAPVPEPVAEAALPPTAEAAHENSPAYDPTPQLKRFEADGANHLSLDTDELVRLPFRRCPECQRDSSKFDRVCIFCHASLESAAARELNLTILATYETDKAREAEVLVQRHQDGIKQIVEEEFKRRVEVEKDAAREWKGRWRLGVMAGAVGCLVLAALWRSFCPSVALVVVAVALVVAALPDEARKLLSSRLTSRWR